MIRYMRPQEIIQTEQFIREPVDSLNQKINENSSKKIIVNGGRGSGKSLILLNNQNKGLGTENQTILMNFDSIISLSTSPNELFSEAFFNHYYELLFSLKLLSYIKSNYALTYESHFSDIGVMLHSISKNTSDFINNIYYEKKTLQKYLLPGEISAKIIERFKKCLGINTLTLAIDRFDWMNGSSAYTQHIISKYFDMFDKIIITVDDLALDEQDKKSELEKQGYSFITANYGKNVDVVKQIIKKRIAYFNEITNNSQKSFHENILTDKIYNNLVRKANGNITIILDTLREIAYLLDWKNGSVEDLEDEFDNELNIQLNKLKQIRKIDATPPKFHL